MNIFINLTVDIARALYHKLVVIMIYRDPFGDIFDQRVPSAIAPDPDKSNPFKILSITDLSPYYPVAGTGVAGGQTILQGEGEGTVVIWERRVGVFIF